MKANNQVILFLFCFLFAFSACKKENKNISKATNFNGFKALKSSESNINFKNQIVETRTHNYFTYEYMYNGGGVAVGDINNDGLDDIYFTGNQVSDKLYLNKGNLKFEDITKSSGILKHLNNWHTGVTMVDLNADGYLDIYVCRSGLDNNANNRANLYFENNKNGTFTEKAKEIGLADTSQSTIAVFFDMDLDGDLDVYIGNHPIDMQKMNNIKYNKILSERRSPTDRLFENANGIFKDISIQSGIYNLSYTLGVSVEDFNDDGYPDIFVSNDYEQPDYLYINQRNNTFKNAANSAFNHMPNFGMGSDAVDLNNDGLFDIVSLDMAHNDPVRSKTNMPTMRPEKFFNRVLLGFHYQYMHNCLQLNLGNTKFSEIAHLAGIAKTDWSWAVLGQDYNNDGNKDLFITNGFRRDMMNNDYNAHLKTIKGNPTIEQVFEHAPTTKVANQIFEGTSKLKFNNKTKEWNFGIKHNSNGAAYSDLDNDGDLDLIVNHIDEVSEIYENIGGNSKNYLKVKLIGDKFNTNAIGAKVELYSNGKKQVVAQQPSRGFHSSVSPVLHFGLDDRSNIDSLIVYWLGNTYCKLFDQKPNQTLVIDKSKQKLRQKQPERPQRKLFNKTQSVTQENFTHKEKNYNDWEKEILLPHKQSQNGPAISVGDANGDGLQDFYVSGAAGQSSKLFFQNANAPFSELKNAPWQKHSKQEETGNHFFDADGDGDLDIYVANGSNEFPEGSTLYQDRLYINNKGVFSESKALPKFNESTQTVQSADYDKDGDLDLFVGGRLVPGKYPFPANSFFLRNEKGKFIDVTKSICKACEKLGMVTSAAFTDYDKDGDEDLIVVGEWMPITVLKNNNGIFEKANISTFENSNGWWWNITAADIDNDGDEDYIVGNLGLNSKFKASKEKPFLVYANDFDDSGNIDIVLSFIDKKGNRKPVRGKECSSEQMPFISEKFTTFKDFAHATIEDIHQPEKINSALKYEAFNFESSIIWNNNGNFELIALPIEAQIAPVLDVVVDDLNNDGHQDILLAGNIFNTEVETSRYDAGAGCLLLGNGTKNFTISPNSENGLYATKDVKNIELISFGNRNDAILVGNNNDKLEAFVILP